MVGIENRSDAGITWGAAVACVLAEVTRGRQTESVHRGHVAVVRADGATIAWAGDPSAWAFFRSCAKPFQALPLVTTGAADAFGYTPEELALACASHDGTARPQHVVLSMLAKAGADESELRCGYAPPLDDHEAALVRVGAIEPRLVQCECSGEHAGMLAACHHTGWPVDAYEAPGHPLQRDILASVMAATGLPASALVQATDGCSLPTWSLPLHAMARAYAVLADPNDAAWTGSAAHRMALLRLRQAMAEYPELISGGGEADTQIIRETEGRVIARLGAEGLLCLAIPEHRLGVAIRDVSGGKRALGPAAVAVLQALDLVPPEMADRLHTKLCPPIRSFGSEVVGAVRPALELRLDEVD
jgi:L-asparaginase II